MVDFWIPQQRCSVAVVAGSTLTGGEIGAAREKNRTPGFKIDGIIFKMCV